jgi:ATPase family associated with various cellular activities (AAA)
MKIELYRIPSSEIPSLIDQYDQCIYWSPDQGKFIERSLDGWKDLTHSDDPLSFLLTNPASKPVFINGIVINEIGDQIKQFIISASLQRLNMHWIFLTPMHVELSSDILPFLSPKTWALPTVSEISAFLKSRNVEGDEYVRAASGLYFRELANLLEHITEQPLLERIVEYKDLRLKQKGILYFPRPTVKVAGSENVVTAIKEASSLLLPEAKEAGIPFPKGIVLIGPPGTGKTLIAKTSATIMNVPLVCIDWAGLISHRPGESEDNIRSVLEFAELIAPCILFIDEVDKAFSSADLSQENSTEKRVIGSLLYWLQERTVDVFVIAACNRVEQVPPEIKRRIPDIFFVDLPHEGDRHKIFCAHLDRYKIDYSAWEDRLWEMVILEYAECTPDEIGGAVDRAVRQKFMEERSKNIDYSDLIRVRSQFTPANIASEKQISAIRYHSRHYKRAASQDDSKFRAKRNEVYDKMTGLSHA